MQLNRSLVLIGLFSLVFSGCGGDHPDVDESSSSASMEINQSAEIRKALSGSKVIEFAPHRLQECDERGLSGSACNNAIIPTKPVRIGVVTVEHIPDLPRFAQVPIAAKAILDVIAAAVVQPQKTGPRFIKD